MAEIAKKLFKGAISGLIKQPEEKKEEITVENRDKLLGKKLDTHFHLKIQKPGGLEETYFWLLNYLKSGHLGKYEITKTSDIFTATESSSYFGDLGSRKTQMQDKVAQYLGTIGNMSKSLFQIIRELRIIDERLTYYDESQKQWSKDKKQSEDGEAAEVALKSIWVDMVEGGAKNPNSVTSLSMQVGFVTLPDFFYKISAKSTQEVDKSVEKLKKEGINRKVREILKRKLFQYYTWKDKTEKELRTRRTFTLKYLRQHYASMKVYINWLKPYLRHINKLELMQRDPRDPEIVTAFETAKIEVEVIAKKPTFQAETPLGLVSTEYKRVVPCIRLRFIYTTIPQMAFQQGYQKGAIHSGKLEVIMESFTPKIKDLKKYEEAKEKEDFEIIESLESSMMSLGDELKNYLEEAGEKFGEKKEAEPEKETMLSPFIGIFKGFGELMPKIERKPSAKKEEKNKYSDQEKSKSKSVGKDMFVLYHIYKKAHGMLSW